MVSTYVPSTSLKPMKLNWKAERFVAVTSFLSAVVMAFTAMIIHPEHDIASGVLMMCAQFLTLTATIFGIDYKFNYHSVSGSKQKDDKK